MSIEMSSYKPKGFAKTSTTKDEREYQGLGCLAHGCPLPGSMSLSTDGQGKWYCRHHFGKKPMENDAITSKINQFMWIDEAATRLLRATDYYSGNAKITSFDIAFENVKGIIKDAGRNDLLPMKRLTKHGIEIDETSRTYKREFAWANRLLEAFNLEIHGK